MMDRIRAFLRPQTGREHLAQGLLRQVEFRRNPRGSNAHGLQVDALDDGRAETEHERHAGALERGCVSGGGEAQFRQIPW
jgi:hypothetical protein